MCGQLQQVSGSVSTTGNGCERLRHRDEIAIIGMSGLRLLHDSLLLVIFGLTAFGSSTGVSGARNPAVVTIDSIPSRRGGSEQLSACLAGFHTLSITRGHGGRESEGNAPEKG
jgi:hypothetical protein